jgi:hypothetical protein
MITLHSLAGLMNRVDAAAASFMVIAAAYDGCAAEQLCYL